MKKFKIFLTAVAVFAVSLTAAAQNIAVTGTVKDAAGEPIVGANVVLQGSSTNYALTDFNGAFKITVPKNGTLEVSSMGYQTAIVPVKGQSALNIVLEDDSQLLDETIVVAFGTATKESFTGSAKVVHSETLEKSQVSDVTRAIEGRVAGVQMTTSSGTLGSSPSIIIRGISSISAGNTPLYVIDGIPYSGDMNNINPADIESLTVLKDAASNALYGSRGANGVIMITTKKAKAGEAVVNVDAKWGLNTKALQDYDYIRNPAVYYETYYSSLYWYYMNQGMSASEAHLRAATITPGTIASGGLGYNVYTLPEGELLIGSNGKLNPNATLGRKVTYGGQEYLLTPDNWVDEAYRKSLRQEYNVSVSGTSGRASFLASFGYLNNKGIVQSNDMRRYTARLKADYQAKPWLKVGANMSYTNFLWNNSNSDEGSAGSTGNIFGTATMMAPIYPLYIRDGEGNIMKDQWGHIMYDYGDGANGGQNRPTSPNSNALSSAMLDVDRSEGNAFTGTGFAEVRFLKDFTFTFNAGVGLDETRTQNMNNMYYGQFAPNGGTLSVGHSRYIYYNLQQILNYNKTFAQDHTITAMLGHENYSTTSKSLSGYKTRLFSPENLELNGAVIDGQNTASSMSTYNTEGYFGRVQYDYKNTVFVSASYRRDASSRFHPNHRWGNFWSAGAAWIISKEPWFKASWIDMLKLKASIGSQGNDGIGNYRYTDTYSLSNNDGQLAISFSNKGKEDISWETNTNFNAGIEFELLKSRINGSVEYFYRKTSDMLFWFTVPASLGYSGYYDNIGDMRNQGIEFNLDFAVIRNRDFQWNINLNGTHYRNKIIRLPDERKTRTIEGYEGYASGNKFVGEGLPLNTFLMSKYAGIDHEDGLPMWYMDLKEDPNDPEKVTGQTTTKKYSDATQYLCSNTTPDLYGGFGTDLAYKGLDFSVQFTYNIGGRTYDSGYARLMANPEGTPGYSIHQDILNAWTPENTTSDIPRFVYKDTNITAASDRFLVPASYLNIQNAQIGYTFPQKWTKKIGVSRLRLYATCDNVWYWSFRKGLDPRQSFTGATNNASNSPVRTISGGINITF